MPTAEKRHEHREAAKSLRANSRAFIVHAKRELTKHAPDCRTVNEHLIHALSTASAGWREEYHAALTPEEKKRIEAELPHEGQEMYETWQNFYGKCCYRPGSGSTGATGRRHRWSSRSRKPSGVPPNRGVPVIMNRAKSFYVRLFENMWKGRIA